MRALKPLLGFLFSILLAAGNTAFAQEFSGQVVKMIVNYGAGGPTDVEARIVAKHLPKYLQGVATVLVRNVGGGGGTIGVNQLGNASEYDRLNISFFTWDPIDQWIHNPALQVRYDKLKFIAGFKQTTLLYIRRDTPPGVSKPADVAKLPRFKAGALSPVSHGTNRQRLALDLLGVKYEIIPGYKGLHDVYVAVRRNDVQLSNVSLPSWAVSVKPTLFDTGIVIPVLQYGSLRDEGSAGRSPDLPDVPTFLEVYKQVGGKDAMPSGEKWEALKLLTRIMDSMYRTVFMPPNAPAAAVAEMRSAMAKLEKDPEFVADYNKVVTAKPRFVLGGEGDRIIADLGKVPPSFVSFLRKYIAELR